MEGHEFRVTGSFGVAIYPNDGTDCETLLANADAAMYRAKVIGRDNFQFYTPEMNIEVHENFRLSGELRDAVARDEFVLHYSRSRCAHRASFAVEALVRWNHPNWRDIAFKIHSARRGDRPYCPNRRLGPSRGLSRTKTWQDMGLPHVTVCVNVSARQFKEKNLANRVVSALRAAVWKVDIWNLS